MKNPALVLAALSALLLSTDLKAGKPPILQSQVKGLLVITLPDGSHAGTASQMNGTAIQRGDEDSFRLDFNQSVGEMMESATREVEKLMLVRHSTTVPKGYVIEFGFADKHTPKDGPSAAVACALMAESIITGEELDQSFAVTGDLTATGEVRPVGGVDAKLRGAARKECEIFAIPKANESTIHDLYVTDGIEAVIQAQIVLVEKFDETLAVAKAKKSDEVTQAIEDFKLVRKAVSSNPNNASHPKVMEKLKSIVEAIPGHESARLVALHGIGRGPKNLSLQGSITMIEERAESLGQSIRDGSFQNKGLDDPLWASLGQMKKLRANVDKRTVSYLDSFLATAAYIREIRGKNQFNQQMERELNQVLSQIEVEANKLRNDSAIQEELMVD